MIYDSPQFIAAVKKIVLVLFGIKEQPNDAIDEGSQSDTEQHNIGPKLLSTEIHTPVPISVKNETQERHPYLKNAKTVAEIIGIAAAIIYACIAWGQWHEMMSSNAIAMSNFRRTRIDANGQLKQSMAQTELTRRNFILDERAYTSIDEMKLIAPIAYGAKMGATAYMINTGKTPAQNVGHVAALSIQKGVTREDEEKAFVAGQSVRIKLPPNVTASAVPANSKGTFFSIYSPGVEKGGANAEPPDWNVGDMIGIIQPKPYLFLFAAGTIEYRDIFYQRRITEFCLWWSNPHQDWQYCETHNVIH
jgi:hypothetical protein